jgi:hypothetical protein
MRVVEAVRQTVALSASPISDHCQIPAGAADQSPRARSSIRRTGRAPVMGRSKPAEKICVSMKRLRSTRRAMIEDLQLIRAVIRATGFFELRR